MIKSEKCSINIMCTMLKTLFVVSLLKKIELKTLFSFNCFENIVEPFYLNFILYYFKS